MKITWETKHFENNQSIIDHHIPVDNHGPPVNKILSSKSVGRVFQMPASIFYLNATFVCMYVKTVEILAFFPLVERPLDFKRARSLSTVRLWKSLVVV